MSTPLGTLRRWFAKAEAEGAAYMVVRSDGFSHADYSTSCFSLAEAHGLVRVPGPMQRVMEVYDISLGWHKQATGRVWNLPPTPPICMPSALSPAQMEKIRNTRYLYEGATYVRPGEVEIVFAEGTLVIPTSSFTQLRNMLDAAENPL